MHITNLIRNLHNQKLHYVLGKNPTSVKNAITLVQKNDAELKIIEGLHNHDLGHEIHNIHQVRMTNRINLDPATHITVLTSLMIVMKQLALDVNLILIAIHHPNALGNTTPTDTLATMPHTKVTP